MSVPCLLAHPFHPSTLHPRTVWSAFRLPEQQRSLMETGSVSTKKGLVEVVGRHWFLCCPEIVPETSNGGSTEDCI